MQFSLLALQPPSPCLLKSLLLKSLPTQTNLIAVHFSFLFLGKHGLTRQYRDVRQEFLSLFPSVTWGKCNKPQFQLCTQAMTTCPTCPFVFQCCNVKQLGLTVFFSLGNLGLILSPLYLLSSLSFAGTPTKRTGCTHKSSSPNATCFINN